MPRASEAPFAPDIVRCLKSWTTVNAGRCSQCSPTNGHQEEDGFHERSPGRRRRTSSRGIAPQKPNRRTPRARFVGGRGLQRHLLSRYSVRAEVRDGEARRLLKCGFSRERLWRTEIWTDGGLRIYGCDCKEERQRRILGDGETEAERTVTDAISSPPPSKGVTPVIIWIKWQKIGHARQLTCLPRHATPRHTHGLAWPATAAARARVARLYPFLSFSI